MSTTITGLPNASTPLDGTERVPMDQAGVTVDATTQAIAALAPGTDLGYNASSRQLSSSTGQDVTLPLAGTDPGLLGGVSFTGPSGWTASGSVSGGSITLSLSLPAGFDLISAADQSKLDGIASGATANATDAQLRDRSTHTGTQAAGTITGLSTVATSGAYADLSGRPTLGTAAATASSDYATAAQGAKADTAVQPAALSGYVQTNDSRLSTDLTYDAATREVRSSTGSDAVLPLVTASAAGLVPAFTSATGKVFTDGGWATPSAGAPGGSSGQLQWNSSGAFAGLSTTSIDGSGNMTFSGRWIQSVNGAASAPGFALTGTWFTGGTTTTTKPHFLIEPAGTTSTSWSTSGTGLGVNAPSGFTGNLLDLQVNGTSRLAVTSAGSISMPASGFVNEHISFGNASGIQINNPSRWGAKSGGGLAWTITNTVFTINGGYDFGFSSSTADLGQDVTLKRDAAGTLAQRNGTAAQAFRLYNTFTSATNFERLNVRWTSNEAILDTEAGSGGGTLRGLKIGSTGTSLLGFYGATPAVQPTAVADATDASTVITQLNALLSRLRTIGIIAT